MPYDPAGQATQLVPSGDRPVPASPAQHSPLAQDEVQAVAPVTVCVAMVQLVNACHRDEGKGVRERKGDEVDVESSEKKTKKTRCRY